MFTYHEWNLADDILKNSSSSQLRNPYFWFCFRGGWNYDR